MFSEVSDAPRSSTARWWSRTALFSVAFRVCRCVQFRFALHFHPPSQQIFVVPPHQKTSFECFLKVLLSRNVSAVFVLVGLVVAVVYETNIVLIQIL